MLRLGVFCRGFGVTYAIGGTALWLFALIGLGPIDSMANGLWPLFIAMWAAPFVVIFWVFWPTVSELYLGIQLVELRRQRLCRKR